MAILDNAKADISRWNENRNNDTQAKRSFNSGNYFLLPKADFNVWKTAFENAASASKKGATVSASIHAYIGTSTITPSSAEEQLSLYCIDSLTDSKTVENNQALYNQQLKQLDYQPSVLNPSNFLLQEKTLSAYEKDYDALVASTQWQVSRNTWVDDKVNPEYPDQGMTQVFVIPFDDLSNVFDTNKGNAEYAMLLFGLRKEPESANTYIIDLRIWAYNETQSPKGILANYTEDFTQPCPPYYPDNPKNNFQLLIYSEQ